MCVGDKKTYSVTLTLYMLEHLFVVLEADNFTKHFVKISGFTTYCFLFATIVVLR